MVVENIEGVLNLRRGYDFVVVRLYGNVSKLQQKGGGNERLYFEFMSKLASAMMIIDAGAVQAGCSCSVPDVVDQESVDFNSGLILVGQIVVPLGSLQDSPGLALGGATHSKCPLISADVKDSFDSFLTVIGSEIKKTAVAAATGAKYARAIQGRIPR
ncbi:hypothetical protein Syun_001705 [Stephania yunnanensis]|uniref:Uncharacterized protein n=1 Tax=Stephania yunnanensis TaxID=152371 RepID=A0AAP0LF94_9MAGN